MPGPYMAVCIQTPRHSPIHRAKNSAAVAAARMVSGSGTASRRMPGSSTPPSISPCTKIGAAHSSQRLPSATRCSGSSGAVYSLRRASRASNSGGSGSPSSSLLPAPAAATIFSRSQTATPQPSRRASTSA